jgi:hypothetical protein
MRRTILHPNPKYPMTRTGKIARLPHATREELNQRLADGQPGIRLVRWLNSLPEVQEVLAREFHGRPINEVNLTAWKQGGFAEWQQEQSAHALATQVLTQAGDLQDTSGPKTLADSISVSVTMTLSRLLRQALTAENSPRKTKTVLRICHHLTQLRRADIARDRLCFVNERLALPPADALPQADFPPLQGQSASLPVIQPA